MKPLSIIVAQSNAKTGESLAKSLYNHFRTVNLVSGVNDLRYAIPKHRADVAVVDLELATVKDVQELSREFPATTIVCTHRLADERMWTQALSAGAADCCYNSDVRAIVLAATQILPQSHAHAA